MPDHREEQILDAIETLLMNQTTAGKNVFRSLGRVVPDVPYAIQIAPGAETEPDFLGPGSSDQWVSVVFIVSASGRQTRAPGVKPEYEHGLHELRKEIHQRLMSDPNGQLGLDFVHEIRPQTAEEPEFDGSTEKVIASRRLTWRVRYRSSVADPSV